MLQVTQYPGIGCNDTRSMDACNSAGINQRCMTAFYVSKYYHLCDMTMTATDEIVISGTSHAVAIMRVMGDEYAPTAKIQCGIHPVINKIATGFCHQIMDSHCIAKIVAMHHMYGEAKLERSAQGMSSYHIAAMDNCLCPCSMRCGYGSGEWFGTVVTIGDDADFQFSLPFLKMTQVFNWRHNCRLINSAIRRNWPV